MAGSGDGKTSLIQAGIGPRVQDGALGPEHTIYTVEPGQQAAVAQAAFESISAAGPTLVVIDPLETCLEPAGTGPRQEWRIFLESVLAQAPEPRAHGQQVELDLAIQREVVGEEPVLDGADDPVPLDLGARLAPSHAHREIVFSRP